MSFIVIKRTCAISEILRCKVIQPYEHYTIMCRNTLYVQERTQLYKGICAAILLNWYYKVKLFKKNKTFYEIYLTQHSIFQLLPAPKMIVAYLENLGSKPLDGQNLFCWYVFEFLKSKCYCIEFPIFKYMFSSTISVALWLHRIGWPLRAYQRSCVACWLHPS